MESSSKTQTPTDASPPPAEGMFAQPQHQHAWLQQLVGGWTFESECPGEEGQAPTKFRGRETVKPLGELWIVGEGEGDSPGGTARMMLTLGFDPTRDRFVGTWVGSMMTHLWVYEGELDAGGRVLTLNAEGPSFTDPKTKAKYQDVIEVISPDHRTLTSRSLGPDGKWTQFMIAHYHRQK